VRRISVARGRALLGCAFFATVTGAASCATTASTVNVSGGTLKIYLSAPPGGAGEEPAADIVAAEKLAFQQAHGNVGHFTVKLVPVAGKRLSDNARSAIEDSKAIAYLGEVEPGASADSIGITNAEDLLQVSPTDTAAELTQVTAEDPGSPGRYYEALGTYGRTFARVVPNSAREAKALIAQMPGLGVSSLYVTSDGSTYGRAISSAVKRAVSAPITLASSPQSATAVFYGGTSTTGATALFGRLAQANPGVKLFAPDALATAAFTGALSPAARQRTYVISPGFLPSALPPAGSAFVSDFRSAYGHAPAPQAIFGYEAMAAVLAVLRKAGPGANNRSTVVADFLKLTRSSADSALGAYSVNARGDTDIAPLVFSRIKGGNLVPFKAAPAQG
jgi:ABC-type branched-subunit amino acid transport system substrate-binding protein